MSSAFEGLPKTPNLKLNKPGYDNVADIEALNENADILDEEIQGIKNTFVKSVNGINAGDGGNVDLGIIPIAKGGTGATTASQACANIGALPTSGGTMTGDIYYGSNTLYIAQKDGKGSRLALYPSDGTAQIRCINPSNTSEVSSLTLHPNGDANWGGKPIETVTGKNLANSGYIKYKSGLILAWSKVASDGNPITVTKPTTFTTLIAQAGDSGDNSPSRNYQKWVSNASTSTTDKFYRGDTGDAFIVFWVGKV